MSAVIWGGLVRGGQALAMAAPTLLVGLFIAALLRYYLGRAGTQRLFGGDSLWSLPQSWLIGMLLPVCSIGVLPILREMHRQGVRPGALTAFALSAPLFNPLSLLYGLTLSRPAVIVGFALGSLLIVTCLGLVWDWLARRRTTVTETTPAEEPPVIGLWRLGACAVYGFRELTGVTGGLTLLAVAGVMGLGMILPHGALQTSVEQMDPMAVPVMTAVAIPVYASPLLTMSQLGMMFAHGNSPGAAFSLLILGTGVNLATLCWIGAVYGWRPAVVWFSTLVVSVLLISWGVDRPLITPGVEPAGHTHAFDIYTNPFGAGDGVGPGMAWSTLKRSVGLADQIAVWALLGAVAVGLVLRIAGRADLERRIVQRGGGLQLKAGFDRIVSPRLVGAVCLAGLVALSVVACYAWYPTPRESLEEIRVVKSEVLSAALGGQIEHALQFLPAWDEWTRKLEVGYAIRNMELRPWQHMQAWLVRKKLEELEHELEHAREHGHVHFEEIRPLVQDLERASSRMKRAFTEK